LLARTFAIVGSESVTTGKMRRFVVGNERRSAWIAGIAWVEDRGIARLGR
jgi:hypothetical protein